MTPAEFIAALLPAAQDCQRRTGIPASLTIAQAALETGWGNKVMGCNLFNIKADPSWHGPVVTFPTTEYVNGVKTATVARFRSYVSWGESVLDHAKFFTTNPRYAGCFKLKGGEAWAYGLQQSKYATDPNYANSLIAVMRGRNLTQYDA